MKIDFPLVVYFEIESMKFINCQNRDANEGVMFVSVNELAQDNTPLLSIPDYFVDVVYHTPELYAWNNEPIATVSLDSLQVCIKVDNNRQYCHLLIIL